MKLNKLFVAILGAVVLAVQAGLQDSDISVSDWVTIGAAALAALGTWLVPNTPILASAKLWVNALVLGAGVVLPLLQDGGLTPQEWLTVLIAVLTAGGVYAVSNGESPKNRPALA